ncbi:MAG: ferrochelatase [Alphaproteobacteria bacterium]
MTRRVAVVLLNLGGPDRPEAVRPFLKNVFSDPAIIGLPQPFRSLLASIVSARREREARAIYGRIGGASPILGETLRQARALEALLAGDEEIHVFVAMRYWHPMCDEVVRDVLAFRPDRIVLLPLYPQFSTSTTESSLADWRAKARQVGLTAPTVAVCCFPALPAFIDAHAALIRRERARLEGRAHRVLFSAHGLPEKIIARGDPYQWQVERTAAAIVAALGDVEDSVVCYQSRVGPLKWIGPATADEVRRAGQNGLAVLLVPIAFVSEHSETLVELDMTTAELARRVGVPAYIRVPALGADAGFVAALAELARAALGHEGVVAGSGARLCPAGFARCGLARP